MIGYVRNVTTKISPREPIGKKLHAKDSTIHQLLIIFLHSLYHSNRCGDCRIVTSSPSVPVPTVQPAAINIRPMRERPTSAVSLDPKDVRHKKPVVSVDRTDMRSSSSVAASSSSSSGTKEGTWKCTKCANSNFPQRIDCNRCGTAKPPSSSSSTSSVTGHGASPVTTEKPISKPKEHKKIVADGKYTTTTLFYYPNCILTY